MFVQPYQHFTLPLYFLAVRSGDVVGGRFRIESLAGSGGMGSVWKALDQQSGDLVALKILHGRDPRDAARFLREAQVIARLSHPGIVRYVADGRLDNNERFLVMEWLEGESLADRLDRAPLSLSEVLLFGTSASEALGALHEHRVVHRDLKPSNLFLEGCEPSRVKVIDFGIARSSQGPEVTRTGVLLGTPGYIAPEQARGDRSVDARADVFALGCVLFKCLTGQGAFGGEDDLTVLLRVVKGTARRAREIVPQLPEEVDQVIAWMLARDPAERPRDALIVAAALTRLSMIYGAGRPADDPLEELITTRSRAVLESGDDPILASTSPFPLSVPRSILDEVSVEEDFEEAEILTEPTYQDASIAFASNVARAVASAEAQSATTLPAPNPPPVAHPKTQDPPLAPLPFAHLQPLAPLPPPRPPTPEQRLAPPNLLRPPTPEAALAPSNLLRPPTPEAAPAPPPILRPPTPAPAPVPPVLWSPNTPPSGSQRAATNATKSLEETADPEHLKFLRAAEGFLKQNDFRNVLQQVRKAIKSGAQGPILGALRTRQAEAHRWRGELYEAEHAGTLAMTTLSVGSDLWWLAAREAVLAAGARGDGAKVRALSEEMLALLATLRPDVASIGTLTCAASYLMHTGNTEALARLLGWAHHLVQGADSEPPSVAARLFQLVGIQAVYDGDLGAYLHACEVSAERFAASSDMRNSLTQRVNVAFAKIELGLYAHAEADLKDAIVSAERMGLNHVVLAARANLAAVLGKRGKEAESRVMMLEVLKESITEGDRRFEAGARTHLALILLSSGDDGGAVREAKGAVELTLPEAPGRAFALGALSRAQLAHGRKVAALEAAEQAMDVLSMLHGIEEGESLIRLVFAAAKRQTGDEEGSRVAIKVARDRLNERAARIQDVAFRQSFLRDVAENAQTLRLAREWLGEAEGQ